MSKECEKLHQIFNSMKKYSFPFDKNKIPKNGIYILFEKGEKAHSGNRVVRIGTHTGKNQLCSRLFQHFVNENKDRSIFRKNIGRALLNKNKDLFLEKWNLDLTTRKAKEKYSKLVDLKKQKQVEKRVTRYIQDNFSFIVFEVKSPFKKLNTSFGIFSNIKYRNTTLYLNIMFRI